MFLLATNKIVVTIQVLYMQLPLKKRPCAWKTFLVLLSKLLNQSMHQFLYNNDHLFWREGKKYNVGMFKWCTWGTILNRYIQWNLVITRSLGPCKLPSYISFLIICQGKETKKYKDLGPAKLPCYKEGFCYISNLFIMKFHCIKRSLGPGNFVCYIRYFVKSVFNEQYKTKQANSLEL